MSRSSMLAFGPQAFWPGREYLRTIRTCLLDDPDSVKFVDKVRTLPDLWPALSKAEPQLKDIPGPDLLRRFGTWFDTGDFPVDPETPPNFVLAPLTVIIQYVQYRIYYRNLQQHVSTDRQPKTPSLPASVQGFCIGFLSALAVACSKNEADLDANFVIALNLAVLIGALVDLDGSFANPPKPTSSLAVHWRCETDRKACFGLLKDYPEAYVSCCTDEDTVTVTAPKSDIPSLIQKFSASRLTVKLIGLDGRFHIDAHRRSLARIRELCNSDERFTLPEANALTIPVRSNIDGQLITTGQLHHLALDSTLLRPSQWFTTVYNATESLTDRNSPVTVFGMVDPIPRSIKRKRSLNIMRALPWSPSNAHDVIGTNHATPHSTTTRQASDLVNITYPDDAVAIVGMSCRFPGADSLEEFWNILTEATSMVQELPSSRFSKEDLRRTTGNHEMRYWGNFLRDPDAFDHQFFGKSSREAKSMDPQQRLVLEVAYEAMQSSGYYDPARTAGRDTDIGCYIGVAATDYQDNVASHPPNAFSSLGTLRAFISGKISHWFGWTGPSITYDTACSSSAVAIHSACKAIQTGDCTAAIAGGVNILTAPAFWQNLAAASFLSPTGACKPFDAAADGYCRGEGVGLVVLKRLSSAISTGDNVLAVLSGSAVGQNANCTPITVPHSESQSKLYEKVLSSGGLRAQDVSYVETHGTGTPVGDPIECESIRKVFGGDSRLAQQPCFFGSVKGNIGHTEAASGVAGLIKTVLMLQYETIPKHASFKRLNPKIPSLELDNMAIPQETQPWRNRFRAACINNYGAAGSNAVLLICQAPRQLEHNLLTARPLHEDQQRYPVVISARTKSSLQRYLQALQKFLTRQKGTNNFPTLVCNLARQCNQDLPYKLVGLYPNFQKLSEAIEGSLSTAGSKNDQYESNKRPGLPVVLAFGGQISDFVGLDEDVLKGCTILRKHLDQCNTLCRSMGLAELFPGIFQKTRVQDLVGLHCMLFSLQYACARSWIDCGLQVDVLIGHSFGQLTALCVSGALSLSDGLRLVSGRAALMQKFWGPDPGSMLSVETSDIDKVLDLVTDATRAKIEIACYNGTTRFVLGGPTSAIDSLQHAIQASISETIKCKRLNTTHAFHSPLVDPIVSGLAEIAREVTFRPQAIPIETCSKDASWQELLPEHIVEHSRGPVYFAEAVKRIQQKFGSCIWLEAGSGSSVVNMARHVLGSADAASHTFQSTRLDTSLGLDNLSEATTKLWKAGVKTQHPPFYPTGEDTYSHVNIPPYQFEKPKHWLEYQEITGEPTGISMPKAPETTTLVSFRGFQNANPEIAEFSVHSNNKQFCQLTGGHTVLGYSLCPASLYMEIVTRAAQCLVQQGSQTQASDLVPSFRDLEIRAPLGLDQDRSITLLLEKNNATGQSWKFTLASKDAKSLDAPTIEHSDGMIQLVAPEDVRIAQELRRYEQILELPRYQSISGERSTAGLQGSTVYRAFSKIMQYADEFQGVQCVYAQGSRAYAEVHMPALPPGAALAETACDPLALDNFAQLPGLQLNCLLEEASHNDVFVCTGVQELKARKISDKNIRSFKVCSNYTAVSSREMSNDIFVFDASSDSLLMVLLGVRFSKVPQASLRKALSKVSNVQAAGEFEANRSTALLEDSAEVKQDREDSATAATEQKKKHDSSDRNAGNLDDAVRTLISEVAEVPADSFEPSSSLMDLGIDSLMMTELLTEINKAFKVSIRAEEFQELTDVSSVSRYLKGQGAEGTIPSGSSAVTYDISNADRSTPSIGTPLTSTSIAAQNNEGDSYPRAQSPILGGVQKASAEQLTSSGDSAFSATVLQSFSGIQSKFDAFASDTKFADFFDAVFPDQSRLVVAYVVESFDELGCSLRSVEPDDTIALVKYIPEHNNLYLQLLNILEDAQLIRRAGTRIIRTAKEIPTIKSKSLVESLVKAHPQYTSELRLLEAMGSKLAGMLRGSEKPLDLLFRSESTRALLEDVYCNGPMYKAATRQLSEFLVGVCAQTGKERHLRILEVGAGTGGTTSNLLQQLARVGFEFTYTFSDVSPALVAAAKRKFARYDYVEFAVLDIEKTPKQELQNRFDIVISTNCVHATKDLSVSCANIRKLVKNEGLLCLVEFTRNLYWFDLVFGPLGGWWLFNDGRQHVLADEQFWKKSLNAGGFQWVDWTGADSEESNLLRIIAAMPADVTGSKQALTSTSGPRLTRRAGMPMETLLMKQEGEVHLMADIYYPTATEPSDIKRPIALMIHGGGHVLLSRANIQPSHVRRLLAAGFLPISVEYRLCPETTLVEGPMHDVCTALEWIRHSLATTSLARPDILPDVTRVTAVGWSTGGHLAMSLGWTAPARGIAPPTAVLAFYSPTDYHDTFWEQPNFPGGTSPPDTAYDAFSAVQPRPITAYDMPAASRAPGEWMAPNDPRSRLVLDMNWRGRTVAVLTQGAAARSPAPVPAAAVTAISPLARIADGAYSVPTFLVHGTADDLVPWQQSRRTVEALRARGVEAQVEILDGEPHLFDLFGGGDEAVGRAVSWLARRVVLP